jgi:7,8-dihydro-6-hydroxymethylpterin-pyrophosphokinase
MDRVFLGLGSNLGDREEYLRAGIRGLASAILTSFAAHRFILPSRSKS